MPPFQLERGMLYDVCHLKTTNIGPLWSWVRMPHMESFLSPRVILRYSLLFTVLVLLLHSWIYGCDYLHSLLYDIVECNVLNIYFTTGAVDDWQFQCWIYRLNPCTICHVINLEYSTRSKTCFQTDSSLDVPKYSHPDLNNHSPNSFIIYYLVEYCFQKRKRNLAYTHSHLELQTVRAFLLAWWGQWLRNLATMLAAWKWWVWIPSPGVILKSHGR